MNYFIKTIDTKILISENEHKRIISDIKNGCDFIVLKDKGITLKINAIMGIYPENSSDVFEDRKNQKQGILHDGEKAVRHFGRWVADSGQVPDDKGNYVPVELDKEYYPEAALDSVATIDEYSLIKKLNADYYEFLGIKNKTERIGNNNFKHLLE